MVDIFLIFWKKEKEKEKLRVNCFFGKGFGDWGLG